MQIRAKKAEQYKRLRQRTSLEPRAVPSTAEHHNALKSDAQREWERERKSVSGDLRSKTRSLLNGQLSSIVLVFVVLLPLFKM